MEYKARFRQQVQRPKYDSLLFDLDDTLYPLGSGLAQACLQNIKDKVHAAKALSRLGLQDCFEGIICFETLNPIHKSIVSDDEDGIEFVGSRSTNATTSSGASSSQIFDIIEHFAKPNPSAVLPKTPIICKPSENAIELALKIANLNPQRTLFFEDSVRNIQAGKRVGLHTVLVGTSRRVKGADYALESIHNLKEAVPELRLWKADIKLGMATGQDRGKF
ncbi:hypothetical protein RIF29_25613 [Crotalaria pallida]|uniref:Uncharacterized protein n=1 Tax=Crotalaria pallida TaxID=3830 RepID=A0AAN9EU36_CROPI